MPSWRDLPFEVKAKILTHYIEITLESGRGDYAQYEHQRRDYDYELQRHRQFTGDVLSVLKIVPDMRTGAADIVASMIKQRSIGRQCLSRRAKTSPFLGIPSGSGVETR